MNISNYSIKLKSTRKNDPLLPKNIRGLIIGKSNCGKSTLLVNLLLKPWLDYDNLLVFGNSLHQMEYQILKDGFNKGLSKKQIANIFENQDKISDNKSPLDIINEYAGPKSDITASFYDDCNFIPDLSSLNPEIKHLLILDDCFLGPQSKAESYYTRGRHNNCDTIYISQNYFRLPRGTIRENANLLMIFNQDSRNINYIHQDHACDLSLEEFKDLCQKIWIRKYDFLTIDLTSDILNGKYRRNLGTFYFPLSLTRPY